MHLVIYKGPKAVTVLHQKLLYRYGINHKLAMEYFCTVHNLIRDYEYKHKCCTKSKSQHEHENER
jgi:hypothetical protein